MKTVLQILMERNDGEGGSWYIGPRENALRKKVWCCGNHRIDISVGNTTIDGQTQNVSHDSLGIFCRKPISVGTVVIIKLSFEECKPVRMKVANCTQTLGGYKIGLELT